jgi:MFS family permease
VTTEPYRPDVLVAPPATQLRKATLAVYAVFIVNGFAFASWASRIPQFRDDLGVSPAQLGLILLAAALGSLVALPLSGIMVTRLGESRAIVAMSMLLAAGLVVAGIGATHGVFPVIVGLALIGFGNAVWDVAMNVHAALVEKHVGRAIMPRFHAGFSVGTVVGALLGSLIVAAGVGISPHLVLVAAVVVVTIPAAIRFFLPGQHAAPTHPDGSRRSPLRAWTEPRTLLIGVFVLCMAFTEGTGNDWLGLAMIDGYGAPAAVGSLTFAIFVAAMTAGRWFGPALLDRHGRVPVLRGSVLLALVGLILVVFSGTLITAMIGAVAWGLGAALGFPVGMSAAGDDPPYAAGRVSTVASIGYTAFLAGPPLIGFLGNHVGVLHSLTVAAGLLALAVVVAGACRPLVPEHSTVNAARTQS